MPIIDPSCWPTQLKSFWYSNQLSSLLYIFNTLPELKPSASRESVTWCQDRPEPCLITAFPEGWSCAQIPTKSVQKKEITCFGWIFTLQGNNNQSAPLNNVVLLLCVNVKHKHLLARKRMSYMWVPSVYSVCVCVCNHHPGTHTHTHSTYQTLDVGRDVVRLFYTHVTYLFLSVSLVIMNFSHYDIEPTLAFHCNIVLPPRGAFASLMHTGGCGCSNVCFAVWFITIMTNQKLW